jgi:hypothetical protein
MMLHLHSLTGLLPLLQPRHQRYRQARLHHLVLGSADVILNALQAEHVSLGVIDAVAGARVAVPRLPHRPRVDNHAVPNRYQPDVLGKRYRGAGIPFLLKRHRHVGMPHQAELRLKVREVLLGDAVGHHVFQDGVHRAAVHQ